MDVEIEKFYRKPGLSAIRIEAIKQKIKDVIPKLVREKLQIESEICFNVEVKKDQLLDCQREILKWILAESFNVECLSNNSWFSVDDTTQKESKPLLLEIGPRLNFSTAWSTNAVSVCNAVGLDCVTRIEVSIRYEIKTPPPCDSGPKLTNEDENAIVGALHDPMTECRYDSPLLNFSIGVTPDSCYEIDLMNDGEIALERANTSLGLSFDKSDIHFYLKLFKEQLQRNPTSVELFDLAQSNSEHSRHWFFKGKIVIDNEQKPNTLMNLVMSTQKLSNANSVIKFCDNSSAIRGFSIKTLVPTSPIEPSTFLMHNEKTRHITLTAETHNFPTGVAPFPGATTGTGGRIRDNHATGRGAHVVAGTAGYCFGNLNIPGYSLPWEEKFEYPKNFASPLSIVIEASNGASDYGNKFGEPVIAGFARSFGMKLPDNQRREWIKPIMFSGGIGSIEDDHTSKENPQKGMQVAKIGGPVYRIGVGGGAASSVEIQGDNAVELDFGAVQRGDPEMEQKLNRVIRACIELGKDNPICSIHDQGAGGNGNVLKEIVEPTGAIIRSKDFILGDPTISTLELWGAEYQESDAILIRPENVLVLKKICEREKLPICLVGSITGDGKIILDDSESQMSMMNGNNEQPFKKTKKKYPVDLPLEIVLGKMPPKTFYLQRIKATLSPLVLPNSVTVLEALNRVLRLPSVASKRYLTNKVDRSVTGLIAQQQCVGPLHTPVADVAVTALSLFDTVGAATAIGEQPIKGLIDPACGARMTIGEALTNLMFAQISDIKDVKCSGNWMYAAKLAGEGALLYDACQSMCITLSELGIAIDGGKDSLSMAARVGNEVVKSPGALVLSVYAACPDITKTITPDLKLPLGENALMHVKLSKGWNRTGGSALAQVFGQIGDQSPDMDDVQLFTGGFVTTQKLIKDGIIKSGHDVSDGGIITTLLEMAFSGNRGISVDLDMPYNITCDNTAIIKLLFAEELGIIIEIAEKDISLVSKLYSNAFVQCCYIGRTAALGPEAIISVTVNKNMVLQEKLTVLRDIWEETSFQLEKLQTNKSCVQQEQEGLSKRNSPMYKIAFNPKKGFDEKNQDSMHNKKPIVAVIREEGSNGDREMVASLFLAGFEVWDVTMQDICNGRATLNTFQGVIFVGGFSYADVFGSAKGWAAVAQFNEVAQREFRQFRSRKDTFSLGVCNGCQLMALLGWVGNEEVKNSDTLQQGCYFTYNDSGRFESRFPTVKIGKSPAIMLKGMENSALGIWVAHGEGKLIFKSETTKQWLLDNSLAPIRYVDDDNCCTMQYPFNPNGSSAGIAALCSQDGRHLAMMPHPERCSQLWQWPWLPENWKSLEASPWLQMFHNARDWCLQ